MNVPVVFDASTLILLAKIELLEEVMAGIEIVVTETVKEESTRKADLFDAKLISKFIADGRIKVKRSGGEKEIRKLGRDFNIAPGEASSLLLAQSHRWALATDDGLTIKACKILAVEFLTAIHFLLRTWEQGAVSRELALAKLEKLERFGRYRRQIIEDARQRIQGGS